MAVGIVCSGCRGIKELGTEPKHIEICISAKGTRLYFAPTIKNYINTNSIEIAEENGELVIKPSENGLKLKLWINRRWDGLPTCYYIAVPKEFREKLKSLQNPYIVAENGRIIIKQKTDEEIIREKFKDAVDRFFRVVDSIQYFEDKRREAEEKGHPHTSIDFNLDLYRETLFLIATRDLSQFYDEIDPGAM